ncbi:MAG: DinB family protein [Calditrichaeota bacterium]|nr:DinB family protein [Calditrichota bacterium]
MINVLAEALTILPRTPVLFDGLLRHLPEEVVRATEGPETWSAFDVIGHLNYAERASWRQRISMILETGEGSTFPQFDREAQFRESSGKSMDDLLDDFLTLRSGNVSWLTGLDLAEADLSRTGTHPSFGRVTLGNLIATWPAHDLTHVFQVVRVIGKRFKEPMGPWTVYNRLVGIEV